jgi:hypothetical protein
LVVGFSVKKSTSTEDARLGKKGNEDRPVQGPASSGVGVKLEKARQPREAASK